jgi:hypothetical protein
VRCRRHHGEERGRPGPDDRAALQPDLPCAWARVRNGAEGDYAYIYNNIGYEAADRVAAGTTSVYTVMVNDAGYLARACLDGANYCTAWY